jgi:hypothetical protein
MQVPFVLTPHDRRRVAVASVTDPRTVERYLAGRRTASTTAARILAALRGLGFLDHESGNAL